MFFYATFITLIFVIIVFITTLFYNFPCHVSLHSCYVPSSAYVVCTFLFQGPFFLPSYLHHFNLICFSLVSYQYRCLSISISSYHPIILIFMFVRQKRAVHPVLTEGIGESILLLDCNLDGDVLDERRGKPFRNRYRYKRKLIEQRTRE